jgi:hypothetical protein
VGRAARTARIVLLFCVSATLASLTFGRPAGAFVVCLESRAVANIADKSIRDAIKSYLKARFDSKVGKVVQITRRFFIVPPPEYDCKRCFYRIIMVSDGKVTESAVVVGAGTAWGASQLPIRISRVDMRASHLMCRDALPDISTSSCRTREACRSSKIGRTNQE